MTSHTSSSFGEEVYISKRHKRFRHKAKQLNNQIVVDIERLDALLKEAQQKKIRYEYTEQIKEEIDLTDLIINVHEMVKVNPIKFKYSLDREYAFNYLSSLSHRNNRISQRNTSISVCGQMLAIPEDGVPQHQEDLDLWNNGFVKLKEPMSFAIVQGKNWIDRYMNSELSDTQIVCRKKNGTLVSLMMFDQEENTFECQYGKKISQEKPMFSDKVNLMLSPKSVKSTKSKGSQKFSDFDKNSLVGSPKSPNFHVDYDDIVHPKNQMRVQFPKHKESVCIYKGQTATQDVVRLKIDLNPHGYLDESIRVLISSKNKAPESMQRVIILQETIPEFTQRNRIYADEKKEKFEKYKIVWSKYCKCDFKDDVLLQVGYNYLVVNICTNPASEISLVFNDADLDKIELEKDEFDPWKSYNLLFSSFEECREAFLHQNSSNSKTLQYQRENFLDCGIVLEIYQNIYSDKIKFVDEDEKEEDKALLFESLYSPLHGKNVYLPEELVIKFFQITETPARLYCPSKKVILGDQIIENVTVSSMLNDFRKNAL